MLVLACSDSGTDATEDKNVLPQAGASGSPAGQGGGGASGQAGNTDVGAGQGGSEQGGGGNTTAGVGGQEQGGGGSTTAGAGGSEQGGGGSTTAGAGGSEQGGSAQGGAGQGGGEGCRKEGSADGVRKVVISHPFVGSGKKGKGYEVLALSEEGVLSKTGKTFEMNTTTYGEIVFTRDGKLGFVAQENGTIGVFSLAGEQPQVLNAAYNPGTYVSRLVMSPSEDRLYVLNDQWRNNGGGVYSVKIGCDDSLVSEGLLAPAKMPSAMAFLPGQSKDVFLAATDVLESKVGDSAHLLALDTKALKGGANAFGAEDAIVTSAVVTLDGAFGLISENSEFSGVPNRIAVLGLGGSGLTSLQVISSINDPFSMIASPFDRRILIASSYGNALLSLKFVAGNTTSPFAEDGPLQYQGKKPQLPGDMVMIQRGSLRGRVLVPEVDGVRQVQFSKDGAAPQDLGLFDLDGEVEAIPGAIGVQP